MPVDMDDEIDVQIHFLVFEYLKKTHKDASKVIKIKFRNFKQFIKGILERIKIGLDQAAEKFGHARGLVA